MTYNRITIIGRLTKDPELKTTPNGTDITTASVAVNRKGKETTDFFDVKMFGKTGTAFNDYARKGRLVLIEGEMQCSSWEKDGQKRYRWDLIANNFNFMDSPKKDDEKKGDDYDPFAEE